MKVLILGGTGPMGIHLVEHFSKTGVHAVVTSRKKRSSKGSIKYIQGNAHDIDFLKSLLEEKWDAIVDFMVYSTPSFKKRVELFLDATSQYVYISSARVYADAKGLINEDSPRLLDVSNDEAYLSTDEYALYKARQEDILKKSNRNNWTIIRPYITYAENRMQLGIYEKEEWLFRALHGRTIVFSEDINSRLTTLTYGFDVAKGIISIIGKSDALGEAFHITSNESKAWSYILNIYLEVLSKYLGYKPKVLLIDIDQFNKIETRKKYQIKYDRLYNRKFDNSKIANYCDEFYTTLEDGINKSVTAFLTNPKFKYIDWKLEAQKDKLTKEHASLKEMSNFRQKLKYILYRYIIKI
jgi:nucleoside-diphosphate-sugar epimerase